MSIELYYFTGTGNSLYAAKELQKLIPELKLIPIIGLMHNETIKTEASSVGFVFPVYMMTVPNIVRKFIQKLDISSADYIFMISTYSGFDGLTDIYVRKQLKKKGKKLNADFNLTFINNSPTGIMPVATQGWSKKINNDNVEELEKRIQERLDVIKKTIINKEDWAEGNAHPTLHYLLETVLSPITGSVKKQIPYFADTTCKGCGTCEKVCTSSKIRLVNKKPEWQKNIQCNYCYACFNACPKQAILMPNYKEKNGRYIHPGVTVDEIAEQKNKETI